MDWKVLDKSVFLRESVFLSLSLRQNLTPMFRLRLPFSSVRVVLSKNIQLYFPSETPKTKLSDWWCMVGGFRGVIGFIVRSFIYIVLRKTLYFTNQTVFYHKFCKVVMRLLKVINFCDFSSVFRSGKSNKSDNSFVPWLKWNFICLFWT